MADELPETPFASKTLLDVLNDEPKAPVTPAVHSDELWGGPRFIENASHEKVWVGTKKAYWKLLKQNGFRMKDQQESTTGDNVAPIAVPKELLEPEVAPMTQQEAQVYGAMRAVFKRYGIIEVVYCTDCFERHRAHGCRVIVNAKEVSMLCRCGKAEYHPPTGTTDTVLDTIANTAITELDKMPGTMMTKVGELLVPTLVLPDQVAELIRAHIKGLRLRNKEPRWFHGGTSGCYLGRPENEDNAMALNVGPNDINILCPCPRQLFSRRKRVLVTH